MTLRDAQRARAAGHRAGRRRRGGPGRHRRRCRLRGSLLAADVGKVAACARARVLRGRRRAARRCWSRRRSFISAMRSRRTGPRTRPVLTRICGVAGCTIRPLRDVAMSHLSIDASDLQADPAHRGLLILTATLRNRAAWTLAYPHLELTLTDAQDQVVVRRALAPADYVGGTADVQQRHSPQRRSRGQGLHRRQRHVAGGVPAVHVLSLSRVARTERPGGRSRHYGALSRLYGKA